MIKIDLIYSKDSSEDVTLKNLLRELKIENPTIALTEIEKDSREGKKYINELGILSFPALMIKDELFSTGMVSKDEILEKISPKSE